MAFTEIPCDTDADHAPGRVIIAGRAACAACALDELEVLDALQWEAEMDPIVGSNALESALSLIVERMSNPEQIPVPAA